MRATDVGENNVTNLARHRKDDGKRFHASIDVSGLSRQALDKLYSRITPVAENFSFDVMAQDEWDSILEDYSDEPNAIITGPQDEESEDE